MIEEGFKLKKRDEWVQIEFDEESYGSFSIHAYRKDRARIGEVQVEQQPVEGGGKCFTLHYLKFLSLNSLGDRYLRQGIGTRMLELYRENCVEEGEPFIAAKDDGLKKADGSHLTGMGLPFVNAMVERGLLNSGGQLSEQMEEI